MPSHSVPVAPKRLVKKTLIANKVSIVNLLASNVDKTVPRMETVHKNIFAKLKEASVKRKSKNVKRNRKNLVMADTLYGLIAVVTLEKKPLTVVRMVAPSNNAKSPSKHVEIIAVIRVKLVEFVLEIVHAIKASSVI